MGTLAELGRGTHFLGNYFGLMALGNLRFVRTWDSAGPEAAKALLRRRCDRALAIAGAEVTVAGEEHIPRGGCVFIYNEASLLDVVLIQRFIFEHATAGVGAELWAKIPWMKQACARSGIVLFKRGDRAASDRMLAEVTARVAAGARLSMGGEGHLTRDGSVGRFKRGGCLVAIRAHMPVVPVALCGGPGLMPVGSLRLRRGALRVAFGAPLSTDGLSDDDAEGLAARVRAAVVAMRG